VSERNASARHEGAQKGGERSISTPWRPGLSPERFRSQGLLGENGLARLDIGTPFYWGHVLEGLFEPALGPDESRAIERWIETRLATRMEEMFGLPAAEAHWAKAAWETRAIETPRHVALFYGSVRWAVLDRAEVESGLPPPDIDNPSRGRRLASNAETFADLRALGKQIAMEIMRRDPSAIQALVEQAPGAASWAAEAAAIAEAESLARVAASAAQRHGAGQELSLREGQQNGLPARKPKAL
jgi:hypothetical protein